MRSDIKIIVKTSDPFENENGLGRYDDEDISTLGSKEVIECCVINHRGTESWCRLMSYDLIKHIDSDVIILESVYKPGRLDMNVRAATMDEIITFHIRKCCF